MTTLKEKIKALKTENHPCKRWYVRLGTWLRDYQWLLLSVLTLVTLYLGYRGFVKHWLAMGIEFTTWDVFYVTLQLFILEAGSVSSQIPWELQIARFMSPAIATYAAVIALMAIFHEQTQLLRLRFYHNHIVVCGLGSKGLHLTRAFHESGHRVVIIEKSLGNKNLSFCHERGIKTLISDATEQDQLLKARVHKAKYLIAVCGDDGTNAEVVVLARDIAGKRHRGILTCFVHLTDLGLCKFLREKGILKSKMNAFRLEFFNIFEAGAQALLNVFPPFKSPAESKGRSESPHILIVGLGHHGDSLVLHAIRDWSGLHKDDGQRLQITMIDKHANMVKGSMMLRYPQIAKYCNLTAQQMDVQSTIYPEFDFLLDQISNDLTIAYICLDDDSLNLSLARSLYQQMQKEGKKIPIVVRLIEYAGLVRFFPGKDEEGGLENLHAFALLDHIFQSNLLINGGVNETISRAIHEDYVCNQREEGETLGTNPSLKPWDELTEDLKESNRTQADHLMERLEVFGYGITLLVDWDAEFFKFSPQEVEGMAKIEHERWRKKKLEEGCKYAPGSKTKKTHPDMVPWERLTDKSKEKNRKMVRELPRYLARAGYQVERISEPAGNASGQNST